MTRPPAPPPVIPGYQFLQLLGSGGFSDVYLYEQELPRRRVAVKVMIPQALERGMVHDFRREADVMAQLSEHPSIITIYGVDRTSDGRPYLAMEYAPRPSLGQRYLAERLAVPEVLTLGVQIAGAVETAHRAGILHRDIKPANILVTAYNRPALTDFGIATAVGAVAAEAGMSVPWSPPEAFADPPWAGPESDVFSLAATLHTLLAGRTPFEVPGASNGALDLIDRIERGEVSPIGRVDVPEQLSSTLALAMSPDPRRRFPTALEFGRALQHVEASMALPITQIDVLDESLPAEQVSEEDGGATRVRGVVTIDAQSDAMRAEHRPFQTPEAVAPLGADPQVDDRTVVRPRQSPPQQDAPQSAPPAAAPEAERAEDSTSKRRRWPLFVAGGVVLAAIATVLALWFGGTFSPTPNDPSPSPVPPPAAPPGAPLEGTTAKNGNEVTFTWANPQPEDGDRYRYRATRPAGGTETGFTTEPTLTVEADPSGRTCVYIQVVRETGQTSSATEMCHEE